MHTAAVAPHSRGSRGSRQSRQISFEQLLTELLMLATVDGWPSRPRLCSSCVTRKGPAWAVAAAAGGSQACLLISGEPARPDCAAPESPRASLRGGG